MAPVIRPSQPGEETHLRDIERRAGERFRQVGLANIADDDPLPSAVLARYIVDGRCWVAVDDDDLPVGYLLVDEVDGCAHVEQVSVRPDAQGSGAGRALLEHADAWAERHGLVALTLTTFRDVPWNAPLYRHLGFRDLADEEMGPGLRRIRERETAHGLDPVGRVCMRRDRRSAEGPPTSTPGTGA